MSLLLLLHSTPTVLTPGVIWHDAATTSANYDALGASGVSVGGNAGMLGTLGASGSLHFNFSGGNFVDQAVRKTLPDKATIFQFYIRSDASATIAVGGHTIFNTYIDNTFDGTTSKIRVDLFSSGAGYKLRFVDASHSYAGTDGTTVFAKTDVVRIVLQQKSTGWDLYVNNNITPEISYSVAQGALGTTYVAWGTYFNNPTSSYVGLLDIDDPWAGNLYTTPATDADRAQDVYRGYIQAHVSAEGQPYRGPGDAQNSTYAFGPYMDTTSETAAYVLRYAVQFNDEATFALVDNWVYNNLRRAVSTAPNTYLNPAPATALNLMGWWYNSGQTDGDGRGTIYDANSANDTDHERAQALLWAHARWGSSALTVGSGPELLDINYKQRALDIIADLRTTQFVTSAATGYNYLIADGLQSGATITLGGDYNNPAAYLLFAEYEPTYATFWQNAALGAYDSLNKTAVKVMSGDSTAVGLNSDWVQFTTSTAVIGNSTSPPFGGFDYGYNAFRIYPRLLDTYRWYGDANALTAIRNPKSFFTTYWGAHSSVAGTFDHDGTNPSAWSNILFAYAAYWTIYAGDTANATASAIASAYNLNSGLYYQAPYGSIISNAPSAAQYAYFDQSWTLMYYMQNLNLWKNYGSHLTKSHTTDANKKKAGNTVSHTTDANKRKTGLTRTHTTDAFLRKQFTKTHTTDSNKRKATTVSHTTDSNKRVAGNTRTHTTDTLKRKIFTLSHTTDSNKRKATLVTHTTDSNKKKAGNTRTHTTDSLKRKQSTVTHTTDAFKRKTNTVSHTTDANKKKPTTVSHTTDSLKRKANTITHTTDALKRKQSTVSHTTDSNKRKVTTVSHTTDSNKRKAGLTLTHTTDANKKKAALTLTHTTDAFKRKQFTLTHTADAYKRSSTFSVSHTTDALKRKVNTLTHTTNSFLRKANTRSHTTDANKRKVTTVTHTTDANKRKTGLTVTHTTDANKRVAAITRTHTTDAFLRKANLRTHTTDANKRKATLVTHTTDSNKRKVTTVSHTTDSNKKKSGLFVTHTTSANKRKAGLTVSHTTDTLKRKQSTLSHTTDSLLRKINTRTHTTDSNKRKATTVIHTTDANKRKAGLTLTHTTDANKKKSGNTRTHTTDALLRKTNTRTHTTDAYNRKGTAVAHTTDSNKRKVTTVSHTTDANKRVAGLTKTHTTDALKRKAFILAHTTDSNKRKVGTKTHTTDALKRKVLTVSHTTDTYVGYDDYSREDKVVLPTNDNTLATRYTGSERGDVAVDDNTTYVGQLGFDYLVHEFKHKHSTNSSTITPTCNLKSTYAPTAATVYLQVYNQNSGLWQTIDSNSVASANTDFTLTGIINTSVSNYYTAGNWVSCRVYQRVA